MNSIRAHRPALGVTWLCKAFSLPRASFYRWKNPKKLSSRKKRKPHPRALTEEERKEVVDVLTSEEFVDQSPVQVYATLLDRKIYYCAPRTMYRILDGLQLVRERRNQLMHPPYQKPELLATKPNQVWSWDITKLKGPVKWSYFYLYVILDIYSRYVTGWMVAMRESGALAKQLIQETCKKQGILRDQLSIHADRGGPMRSKDVAFLLVDLGVTKTHTRPYTSTDNPYSEAQFKTMKYRPAFPERFGSYQDARAFCHPFFNWYNTEHRHSGIALLTPETVHYGKAEKVLRNRQTVLDVAYQAHPERFVRKPPQPLTLPSAAWINPPTKSTGDKKTGSSDMGRPEIVAYSGNMEGVFSIEGEETGIGSKNVEKEVAITH